MLIVVDTGGWPRPLGRAEHEAEVRAPEAERVAHRHTDLPRAKDVWNVIKAAMHVRPIEVDGGGNGLPLEGDEAGDRLEGRSAADHVAGHALGGTHRDAVGRVAERQPNCAGLCDVPHAWT